jgi:hypothetical protein
VRLAALLALPLLLAACGEQQPPKPPGPVPPELQRALDDFSATAQQAAERASKPRAPARADFKIAPSDLHGDDLWDAVVSPVLDNGVEEPPLNASQHTVYALFLVDYEIQNGGLAQLYYNSAGEYAGEAPALLRAVGAREYADVLAAANALFPTGVPRDRAARQALLQAIDGKRLEAIDSAWPSEPPLADFVEAYIRAHASDFFV